MFTVITGNEIVVDIHVTDDFKKAYEAVGVQTYLGGAHVFNALALADGIRRENLDGNVYMLGTVSTDRFGRNFRAIAAERGINTTMAPNTDADTLLALVQRDAYNNSFYFPNIKDNAVTATRAEHLPVLIADHKILVMQGLCSTVKPSGDAWLDYAKRDPRMMVVYDANIRMPVIPDVEQHKKLLKEWAGVSTVMKISDADIECIYGRNANPVRVVREYLDAGTGVVCITRGTKAVQTYTAHEKIQNPVAAMNVENTVGAGDNFTAGLTLGFARAGLFDNDALKAADTKHILAAVQNGIRTSVMHLLRINQP